MTLDALLDLDVFAGLLCGLLATCLFVLHIISERKRHNWLTLPAYVRIGLWVTGLLFMVRSVNFYSIADGSAHVLGHINLEGMLALVSISYTVGALTVWAILRTLPSLARQRLERVEQELTERPDLAPVLLDPREVEQAARVEGIGVNLSPPPWLPRSRGDRT